MRTYASYQAVVDGGETRNVLARCGIRNPMPKEERAMVPSHLRVYYGPEEDLHETPVTTSSETVSVPLGEILPLLADAFASERTWLRDFESDEISISTDLYEVILAYQHYRRPGA